MAEAFKCESCGKLSEGKPFKIIEVIEPANWEELGRVDVCSSCYAIFKSFWITFTTKKLK